MAEKNHKKNHHTATVGGLNRAANIQDAPVQPDNSHIDDRLQELNHEWDVERTIQLNAAVLAIAGTALGILVNRRWFALPVLAATFMAQHSIQGWSPLVFLFKRFGFRDKTEISREKYALKALRGDFKRIGANSEKAWKAVDL